MTQPKPVRSSFAGMSAVDVFTTVAGFTKDAESFLVEWYVAPPDVTERVADRPQLRSAIQDATAEPARLHFWDTFLYHAAERGIASEDVIAFSEYRNIPASAPVRLSRRDILANRLRHLAEQELHSRLNLLSKVRLRSGGTAHVAMLDFVGSVSDETPRLLLAIAKRLLPEGGFLLRSDRSFHLLGRTLVSSRRRSRLHADSLFYCPLVDRMYLAHQVRRGVSSLRVSPSTPCGRPPYVVAAF
jgi:hypothetical protein